MALAITALLLVWRLAIKRLAVKRLAVQRLAIKRLAVKRGYEKIWAAIKKIFAAKKNLAAIFNQNFIYKSFGV